MNVQKNAATANTSNATNNTNTSALSDLDISALCDESVLQLLDEPFEPNTSTLRNDVHYKGFDSTLGQSWIYPTNLPIRQYQFNITRAALFKNTLVVLPTGLGKTFIAAVVMYNIFRWYPNGKIIFMAPTRPLVAQQIEACYKIMGIPRNETVELTGKQIKKNRAIAWQTKRVFFVTPQVVWSDLNDSEMNFPVNDIKLIVVDEAHKAKGKYAYTEAVQSIAARNKLFRMLALSATPGRAMKDVVEVVQNLLISHIEVRCETSIDVAPYTYKKNIRTNVVLLGEYLSSVRDKLINLINPYVKNLIQYEVITGHTGNLSKGWLILERNRFRDASISNRHPQHSNIIADFGICISLYHALELLERHGIRVFLNYFDDNTTSADEKYFVLKDPQIKGFLNEIREKVGPNPFGDGDTSLHNNSSIQGDFENVDFGHPKFEILRKCLTEHFQEHPDSKAIVFCEYRESVFLIRRLLLQSHPLVKSKVFVGQGASHARTITQKEQIAIMNDFRKGVCNTLIATCVAEEGIDVGEVDLIVCFDINNRNPTRYIQRIGRTGRKRQGKVIMLVTEGREHHILKDIMASKDGTNQKIAKSKEVKNALYRQAPRMVPPEFNPQCVETVIKIDEDASVEEDQLNKKVKKKDSKTPKRQTARKRVQPSRKTKSADVRQFFPPVEFDAEERDVFDVPQVPGTSKAPVQSTKTNRSGDTEPLYAIPFEVIDNGNQTSEINPDLDKAISMKEKLIKISERYKTLKSQSNIKPLKIEEIIEHQQIPNNLKRICLKNNTDFVDVHCLQKQTSKYKNLIDNLLGGQKNILNLVNSTKKSDWPDLEPIRQNLIYNLLDSLTSPKTVQSKIEKKLTNVKESENVPMIPNLGSEPNAFVDSELNMPAITKNETKYNGQRMTQCDISNNFLNVPMSSTPKKIASTPKVSKIKAPIVSPIKDSPIAKAFERSIQKMNNSMKEKNHPPHHLQYLGLNSIDDLFSENEEEMPEQGDKDTTNVDKTDLGDKFPMKSALVQPSTSNFSPRQFKNVQTETTGSNNNNEMHFADTQLFEEFNFDEIDVIPATQIPDENIKIGNATKPTQYSVSQILRICNTGKTTSPIPSVSASNIPISLSPVLSGNKSITTSRLGKRSKNLYVGSVSDLFRDDDIEDMDTNSKIIGACVTTYDNSKLVSTALKDALSKNTFLDDTKSQSGSDCTEEYDFNEVMHSSPHKSNECDKKVDVKNISQSSNKENCEIPQNLGPPPIKKQRSADMFATFDELCDSTVNRSKSTPSNLRIHKDNPEKNISKPTTYLESFIENARTSPKIIVSSPEDNAISESRSKSPSMLHRLHTRSNTQKSTSSLSLLEPFEKSVFSAPNRTPPHDIITTHAHLNENDRSPSVFGNKPNLSRLQLRNRIEKVQDNIVENSSPFLTCKEAVVEKPLQNELIPQQCKEDDVFQDIRSRLAIFQCKKPSSSEVHNKVVVVDDSDTPDEDEIFATCKLASPFKKPPIRKRSKVKRKLQQCAFIDDEAGVSGDESSDEDMDDFLTQIEASTCHDEGDPNVDMRAKYLQSIRSPLKFQRFRIPPPDYRREQVSNIFSQIDPPDESTVLEDSFVVESDVAVEEDEESEMSELERAELLLMEKRRLKRKIKDGTDINDNGRTKRRRRIVEISDSESDD